MDYERELASNYDIINSRNTNGLSVKDIVKLTGVPKATLYVEIRKKRANNLE